MEEHVIDMVTSFQRSTDSVAKFQRANGMVDFDFRPL